MCKNFHNNVENDMFYHNLLLYFTQKKKQYFCSMFLQLGHIRGENSNARGDNSYKVTFTKECVPILTWSKKRGRDPIFSFSYLRAYYYS